MTEQPSIRSVAVYAASSGAVSPVYAEAARTLGTCIARRGWALIYGAGRVGLMGEVARAVHAEGGHIIGVIPQRLTHKDIAYDESDEYIVTDDLRRRKEIMETRADAFIALPGGFGTLEEILEVIVLKQLDYHRRPIVFLNTAGFYDALFAFFGELIQRNFIKAENRRLYHAAATPEAVLEYLDQYVPPHPQEKWL